MNQIFENRVREELTKFLLEKNRIDERMPECQDLEEKWKELGTAYLPDGMREFQGYPLVSLGWVMFLGMAVAKLWDQDWERYGKMEKLYESIRDSRGYDYMDEYILEEVLKLTPAQRAELSDIVGQTASIADNLLMHQRLEPGSTEAFYGYVACLHQLYLMGIALQLKAMGYHMTALRWS